MSVKIEYVDKESCPTISYKEIIVKMLVEGTTLKVSGISDELRRVQLILHACYKRYAPEGVHLKTFRKQGDLYAQFNSKELGDPPMSLGQWKKDGLALFLHELRMRGVLHIGERTEKKIKEAMETVIKSEDIRLLV